MTQKRRKSDSVKMIYTLSLWIVLAIMLANLVQMWSINLVTDTTDCIYTFFLILFVQSVPYLDLYGLGSNWGLVVTNLAAGLVRCAIVMYVSMFLTFCFSSSIVDRSRFCRLDMK